VIKIVLQYIIVGLIILLLPVLLVPIAFVGGLVIQVGLVKIALSFYEVKNRGKSGQGKQT
jgi:hypothetical protein